MTEKEGRRGGSHASTCVELSGECLAPTSYCANVAHGRFEGGEGGHGARRDHHHLYQVAGLTDQGHNVLVGCLGHILTVDLGRKGSERVKTTF